MLQLVRRSPARTMASNSQGVQDDPSLVAEFRPDFTFPQGLQGDLSNMKGNDAICHLWLEKCKLYGYDNCEERLQQFLNSESGKKN